MLKERATCREFGAAFREPSVTVTCGDVADRTVFEEGLEVLNAGEPAVVGGFLEAWLDGFQPAVGEFLEGEAAGVLGLAEAGDLLAEVGKATIGKLTIGGLERAAKLLAVTFDEGIVNAR
jgi:hypothetical protein